MPKVPVEAQNIETKDISRTTTNAAGESMRSRYCRSEPIG